jgi:transcriptional regulator with XRE-family HTH domain
VAQPNPGARGENYGKPTAEELPYAVALGGHLRGVRRAARLSDAAVTRASGLGRSTLAKVEGGQTRVRPSTLRSILTALTALGAPISVREELDHLLAVGGPCIASERPDVSVDDVLERRRQRAAEAAERRADDPSTQNGALAPARDDLREVGAVREPWCER